MPKDPISRADELTALGWPSEEVARYAELWEYRRRWGSMNLEREDRLFLRKAEAALPPLPTGKAAARKSIREKSYYRWLRFNLEAMQAAEASMGLAEGECGAWTIVLEEELKVLDSCQPVLGLPDTIKARELTPMREAWAAEAAELGRSLSFDFAAPLIALKEQQTTSWKPLRDPSQAGDTSYPVLDTDGAAAFRARIGAAIDQQIRSSFPSLADSNPAPEPAAPESGSETPSPEATPGAVEEATV
ncbi:hypothetical protein EVJ50_06355 [Synechococcus sp. RSCCF101]|uniref:hypothetical protein n=1 Tax=Synechococcus sp. RSCCF101 TaxID=2511069 RepID=UPI0012442918|nr:hypothetical protein [Synechococcus sp. RSCCF101]QEY31919.1 hypothetical protein EVJ50_06355 [Synechococcus sp. RSCCF101]